MNLNSFYKYFLSVILLGLITACGGGGGDAGVGGTSDESLSEAEPACEPTDDPVQYDILGQVSFSSSTINAGGSVELSIPVDAQVSRVQVRLRSSNRASLAGTGSAEFAPGSAQTVNVVISTGGATGTFYPDIKLCSSISSCSGWPPESGFGTDYKWPASNPDQLTYDIHRYTDIVPGDAVSTCLNRPSLTINPV